MCVLITNRPRVWTWSPPQPSPSRECAASLAQLSGRAEEVRLGIKNPGGEGWCPGAGPEGTQVLEVGEIPRAVVGIQEARGGGPRMTPVFKEWGFLTRAWGQRDPRASRGQGVRGDPHTGSAPRIPWLLSLGYGTAASPAPVPTCSRRFCQRPHGLSSRMSLSSSLSSSRSRSRPLLGAGSGAAMARRAQAAALRASPRPAPARPGPAPSSPTWSPAERPPRALLGSGNWEARARSGPEGGAAPPLRSRLCRPVLDCSSIQGGRTPPQARLVLPDHSCFPQSSASKRRAPQRHHPFLRRPLQGFPGSCGSPSRLCLASSGTTFAQLLKPVLPAPHPDPAPMTSVLNSARCRESEWGIKGQGHLGAGTSVVRNHMVSEMGPVPSSGSQGTHH